MGSEQRQPLSPSGLSYRAISDQPEPNYRPVFWSLKVGNRCGSGYFPQKSDLPVLSSTRAAGL